MTRTRTLLRAAKNGRTASRLVQPERSAVEPKLAKIRPERLTLGQSVTFSDSQGNVKTGTVKSYDKTLRGRVFQLTDTDKPNIVHDVRWEGYMYEEVSA